MTEAEWLACTDPQQMLGFLRDRGKLSERKARLFAVACCRRIWHLLTDENGRRAVETAEEYADGRLSMEVLFAANRASSSASYGYHVTSIGPSNAGLLRCGTAAAAMTAWLPDERGLEEVSLNAARWAGATAGEAGYIARKGAGADWPSLKREMESAEADEGRVHLLLLQDIFNPCPLPLLSHSVLTWNDAVVVRLAQAAYEERQLPEGTLDNGRLAVLADALEEAGCSDADILGHLRGPGPHVRGCWPIDLVLGKS